MKISELVDIDGFRELCENFSALTGLVTAILDLEGSVIIATGWQDICTRFHRVHPLTAQRCRESDTILAGQRKEKDRYTIYKCKNGLIDVAAPININGEHIGNFFTGQFFLQAPDISFFIKQADEFKFDKIAYLEALSRVPIIDENYLKTMTGFFYRLSHIIGEMGHSKKRLEEANVELNTHRNFLEEQVKERTIELTAANMMLQAEIAERKRMEEALQEAHDELEIRVKERTSQLQALNTELESFSYSISHDLRAPLRAIDGFSRIILKKQGAKFDEDTLNRFKVIRRNTEMMGQLIDGLLELSRLGRKGMNMSIIYMDNIINEVWEEIEIINQGRKISLSIKAMPPGFGDVQLIRQVYSNLLSNAVKFTKNRDVAVIEAGGYIDDKRGNIYYVKDNGAGFDMNYYDKLFGVFQRLHRNEDFEGTGIGLATTQRIVSKHGGRVWAEGKVNEGATFYFSLPVSQTPKTNKPPDKI